MVNSLTRRIVDDLVNRCTDIVRFNPSVPAFNKEIRLAYAGICPKCREQMDPIGSGIYAQLDAAFMTGSLIHTAPVRYGSRYITFKCECGYGEMYEYWEVYL